jgi:hypothetical protein
MVDVRIPIRDTRTTFLKSHRMVISSWPLDRIKPAADAAGPVLAELVLVPRRLAHLLRAVEPFSMPSNWATAENANAQSPYYRKLDTSKVAVFGHSCGGLQALEIAPDPRVKTVLVVDSGILNSPGAAWGCPCCKTAHEAQPDLAARRAAVQVAAICRACPAREGAPCETSLLCVFLLGGETDIAYANGMDDFKRISFLSSLPTRASATAEHSLSPTVATGRWLLSPGSVAIQERCGSGEAFHWKSSGIGRKDGWTVDKKNIP